MTWVNWLLLNAFEITMLALVWAVLFCWMKTIEWYATVNIGRSWLVIFVGSIALIPVSPILYFTHARKFLNEQEKEVDKK